MHHLRSLSLAGNPITAIMNDSFVGLERLEELDISQIRADGFSVRREAVNSKSAGSNLEICALLA